MIIFWMGTTRSRSLTLSKNATCLTMGTLFMASPVFLPRVPTAIESRFVTGMVPRSVKRARGHEAQVLAVGGEDEDRHFVRLGAEAGAHRLDHPIRHVEEQLVGIGDLGLLCGHGASNSSKSFIAGGL